jgi:hypothetical protein
LRIVGVPGDDTGSTVNQLIVLAEDFLNPWKAGGAILKDPA